MANDRKRLALCFDGTWNNLNSHTNVSRLYAEIGDESIGPSNQRKFYDQGVGTGMYDRIRGGVFGAGLDKNIRVGYAWLASVYEASNAALTPARTPEDTLLPRSTVSRPPIAGARRRSNGELLDTPMPSSQTEFIDGSDIYLFGFSRGAFTARSLGGIVNYLGIPDFKRAGLDPGTATSEHALIAAAWKLYAERPTAEDRAKAVTDASMAKSVAAHDADVAAWRTRAFYPVRIHFVGVWDTVGALGVPKIFDHDWVPRFSSHFEFHDTTLGECIRNAFHAVAIDEHRLPYTPTLWSGARPTTEAVEQRWFPGAHADVGGGYDDDLLPAPPLKWLADRAAACGLEFVNDRHVAQANGSISAVATAAPAAFDLDGKEYLSPVHDSYAEFLGGAYRLIRSLPGMGGPVYRRMLVAIDGINQTIDDSAFAKWRADADYRPPNLGQAGRTDVSFNVAVLDIDPAAPAAAVALVGAQA
jgi:uncharacterized protein (DUF2235 family)